MVLAKQNKNTANINNNRNRNTRKQAPHYLNINGYQTATYTGSTRIMTDVEEFKGKQRMIVCNYFIPQIKYFLSFLVRPSSDMFPLIRVIISQTQMAKWRPSDEIVKTDLTA
jgi:hypothetical protein